MMRLRSLQAQLLAWLLGLVLLVWLLTAVFTWMDTRHELDELLDSHLTHAAGLLIAWQAHEQTETAGEVDTPLLHRYAPRSAFQVFRGGRLMLRSANAPAAPMAGVPLPAPEGFSRVAFNGKDWRVFTTHGALPGEQIMVGERIEARQDILWALLRSTLWPIVFALPLLALALWWAVRRGVAPLQRLGQALAQRPPHDLRAVALDRAPSEMGPLLGALNGLLNRIDGLLTAERRFTADAAHELRTPIAAIRAQAQVALGETQAERRRHALQATLAGCDRTIRLVDQLLTLARLDADHALAASPLDLSALVRQVVADLVPAALQKQQTVTMDAERPHPVPADPALAAVLVRNLVDNAIRYSPAQATVQISVVEQAGRVWLQVQDSGPGIAEAQQARLGERFFRVLGSGETGSGLGWSIVRRIATAHRAELQLARAELGGLCVRVGWPRETAPAPQPADTAPA